MNGIYMYTIDFQKKFLFSHQVVEICPVCIVLLLLDSAPPDHDEGSSQVTSRTGCTLACIISVPICTYTSMEAGITHITCTCILAHFILFVHHLFV